MTYILPKQKHTFKVGSKTLSLYPVYRGNGVWRIRLDIQGHSLGRWMPYEAECKSSIRSIELKDCFRTLARYLKAAKDHRYSFRTFCEEAGFPYDDDENNSKSWGCYDAIMSTWNYLENSRIATTLLNHFLQESR